MKNNLWISFECHGLEGKKMEFQELNLCEAKCDVQLGGPGCMLHLMNLKYF